MTPPLFPRRLLFGAGIAAAASLALAFALGLHGSTVDPPTAGSDGYSTSALGHRAFVELLQVSGLPVVLSRADSGARTSEGGLLVVAQPRLDQHGDDERLGNMLEEAPASLLVLPRRFGIPAPGDSGWVQATIERPTDDVERVLAAAGLRGEIVRLREAIATWRSAEGAPPRTPSLPRPQLLREAPPGTRALVEADAGVLLAVREPTPGGEEGRLFVLADPDVLTNHGLAHGENAALLVELVASLVTPGHAVVLDETLHGHHLRSHLWAELLRFPLVVLLLHGVLVAALLGWAASVRFGPPLPDPPAFEGGKAALVENTAQLLLVGRHGAAVLERFRGAQLDAVGRAFRLPAATASERDAHLARLARERGRELPDDDGARSEGLLAAARALHHWREAMLHGET